MNMNETLAAAFANISKWEAEQHEQAKHIPEARTPEAITQTNEALDGELRALFGHDSSDAGNAEPVAAQADDEVSTWQHVSEVAEPMVKQAIKIKGLDEKAVLIQLKRRMYSPHKLDEEESRQYGAGNVNKHLFEGRDNRVKEAISKYTDVYTYLKDNTVPWATGVEMLNINSYVEVTAGLRERIDAANVAVDDLCANWDFEVQNDLARLAKIAAAKGKPNLANPNDYPSADELRKRFGIEVRFLPIPTANGFDPRLGISEEDKASLQKQLEDAEASAAKHVINEMLKPMRLAVDKLAVPIGDDGSIFRDSMIDNMLDVAQRMGKANVCNDPEIENRIKDLQALVTTYSRHKDVLRSMPEVRAKAVKQIDSLMGQMAALV